MIATWSKNQADLPGLGGDLAFFFGVATKTLNRAVKRNRDRFPGDFMFQLTGEESESLRFQFGTLTTTSRNRLPRWCTDAIPCSVGTLNRLWGRLCSGKKLGMTAMLARSDCLRRTRAGALPAPYRHLAVSNHGRFALRRRTTAGVPQTSQSAVSRVSQPADRPLTGRARLRNVLPIRKSAIPQVGKPAVRTGQMPIRCSALLRTARQRRPEVAPQKRQRTGALLDASRPPAAARNRGASRSAAALRRFLRWTPANYGQQTPPACPLHYHESHP
jgi:hypothetical protein